jgi:hypothetical protein
VENQRDRVGRAKRSGFLLCSSAHKLHAIEALVSYANVI